MSDLTPEQKQRNERYERKIDGDRTLHLSVHVSGLRADLVHVRPIPSDPGQAAVDLAGLRAEVGLSGPIEELRAVVQEVDRQLAVLEVEGRVDAAVSDEADGSAVAG